MSRLPTTFATAALVCALVAPSLAEAASRGKRSAVADRTSQRFIDRPDRFGWYPRNADQLKIGSRIWFDQMEAEGRFGGGSRSSR
jgi:hypothetical protein